MQGQRGQRLGTAKAGAIEEASSQASEISEIWLVLLPDAAGLHGISRTLREYARKPSLCEETEEILRDMMKAAQFPR